MQNKYLIFIVPLFGVMSIATLMSMEQEPMSKQLSGGSTHSSSNDHNESQDIVKGIEQMKIDQDNKSKFLFQNLKIEDIVNNHLIAQYPDAALEYFEKNQNNKEIFKDYLSHISYDLGEIGHDYRYKEEFENAAKSYLLSIDYYYNNGETDLACFLSEINAFEGFTQEMSLHEKIQKMATSIKQFENEHFSQYK